MTTMPARLRTGLPSKVAQLRRRRQQLAEQINTELRRPAPCGVALKRLKRQRLRLKDQIAYYSALLANSEPSRKPVSAS